MPQHLVKTIDPEAAKIQVVAGEGDQPNGYIEGYASVFGNVDLGGEVVVKGAFAKTLKERLKKGMVKLYDSHMIYDGSETLIGLVEDAKEDDYGLWFRARFSSVQRAQDVRTKVREGIMNALSFGYEVLKDEVDESGKVRYLKEIKLYEISVVPWGMNPKAAIDAVKGEKDMAKGVVALTDFGLAQKDHTWDSSAAVKRFRKAISDEAPSEWTGAEWNRFHKGFLWLEPGEAQTMGGHYFPLVDVVDGKVVFVFRAASAALAAVRGGRGAGSDPWTEDAEKLETQLKTLYERFEAPWPEKGEDLEALEQGSAHSPLIAAVRDYRDQVKIMTLRHALVSQAEAVRRLVNR